MPQARPSGFLSLLGALVVAGVACGGPKAAAPPSKAPAKPTTVVSEAPPLCALETKLGLDKPPRDRSYTPGYWSALLVQGYRSAEDIARPIRDCRGTLARVDHDGCGAEEQTDLLPPVTPTPKDVVVASLGDARRIVWVMTDSLSDGQKQGPVAIAEMGPKGINVRALGVLRAFPSNVVLRIEKVGSGSLLIADGERCAAGQSGEACERFVRLVPLVGTDLTMKPLLAENGACLGRSLVAVRSSGNVPDGHGGTYRIEALVTTVGDAVMVREQLAVDGQPHKSDSSRASYVTRLQADRQITVREGNLFATGPSLLSRWLSRQK